MKNVSTTDFVRKIKITKGDHVYLFSFNPLRTEHIVEVTRQLGRFASNQDLNFDWHDAAVAAQYVSALAKRARSAAA